MKKRRSIIVGLVVALMLSWLVMTPSAQAVTNNPPTPTVSGHYVPDDPTRPFQPQMAHWTWGWVTGTVYLNRNETSQLSFGASLSGILGAALRVSPVGAVFGTLAAYAAYVYRQGHCVKFKLYPGPTIITAVPGEYWGTSGGGYCR